MDAYLVANITVTDPVRYQEYRARVGPVVAQHGGRFLVRAGALQAVEGDWALDRLVVIAFPSMAALKRFYDSEEYAPLLRLRTETTRSQVVFVEGPAPA